MRYNAFFVKIDALFIDLHFLFFIGRKTRSARPKLLLSNLMVGSIIREVLLSGLKAEQY